jgi:hypothetical protein
VARIHDKFPVFTGVTEGQFPYLPSESPGKSTGILIPTAVLFSRVSHGTCYASPIANTVIAISHRSGSKICFIYRLKAPNEGFQTVYDTIYIHLVKRSNRNLRWDQGEMIFRMPVG